MYKMGLLKGERQKSANIVGQTMKLNPHGDAAIYETMVRPPPATRRCSPPSWSRRATLASTIRAT